MNRVFFYFAFVVLGCNESASVDASGTETVHAQANDTIVTGAKPLRLEGCYQMTLKKDTARLQLQLKDSTISGTLSYHWYEKDRNEGFIKGVWRNDHILADYTFQSEGTTSVREVVFKVNEQGNLVEGFGDLAQKGGKLVFVNKDSLQYHDNHPFIRIACNNQ